MDVLVVSIKTIPDIDGSRRLYDLHGLSDEDVAKAVQHMRRQQGLSEDLPLHLQRIVCISAILSSTGRFKVWSLGDESADEQDMLQRFYEGLARYKPCLVTWSGRDFDLPVIQFRSLMYPLNAGAYWGKDTLDDQFSFNKSHSYNHDRHIDLKDVLANNQTENSELRDELAQLCSLPGSRGDVSLDAWDPWLKGDTSAIREQGETSVLKTYLLYLSWERNRGHLSAMQHEQQCSLVRDELKRSGVAHLLEFEKNWM